MIHDIDIALDLAQSQVVGIAAVGSSVLSDSFDIANARLEFANGCVANLTASRISSDRIRTLRVFKTDAYFSLDYHTQKASMACVRAGQIEHQQLVVTERNALLAEIQDFCRCASARVIGSGLPQPKVPGADGLLALQTAAAIAAAITAK
jgi:predicted dehydrogenase